MSKTPYSHKHRTVVYPRPVVYDGPADDLRREWLFPGELMLDSAMRRAAHCKGLI